MVKKPKSQTFLIGAFILTVSSIVVKLCGALFKIPLTNLINDDGMGYFNSAYVLYNSLYILATAGMPITVSKMISSSNAVGRKAEGKKILGIAIMLYGSLSLLLSLFVFCFPTVVAGIIGNSEAAYALRAISPSIFLVSTISALKGYFQGNRNMQPTAISNVIEALTKLIFGLLIANYMMNNGYSMPMVAAGAILGVTVGALINALYMMTNYLISGRQYTFSESMSPLPSRRFKVVLKEFLLLCIPVLLGALTMNLTNLIDLTLIMRRLVTSGLTEETALKLYGETFLKDTANSLALREYVSNKLYGDTLIKDAANSLAFIKYAANKQYGAYSAMAVTMFNLPMLFITALSTSVVPVISGAFAAKNKDKVKSMVNQALRLTSLVTMVCALGISVMSKPILTFLFSGSPKGIEIAAPLLSILAIAILGLGLSTVMTGMFQAIGKPQVPVLVMFFCALVKIVLNYFLIANPAIGITAAPIGTNVCYLLMVILDIFLLYKYTGVFVNIFQLIVKPLIASGLCAAAAYFSYGFIILHAPQKAALILSLGLAAIVYLIMIIVLKILTAEDLEMLPFGKKLKFSKKS